MLEAVFHVLTGGWRETSAAEPAAPGVVPAAVATAGRLTEIRVTPVDVDDLAAVGWVVELACAPFAAVDRCVAATEHLGLSLVARLGYGAGPQEPAMVMGVATGPDLTCAFAGFRPLGGLRIGESFDAHVRLRFQFGSPESRQHLEATELAAINAELLSPLRRETAGMPAQQLRTLLGDMRGLAEQLRQHLNER
ncbi:hypothetical protein [Rhodanobacter sp. FW106-PBR-LB-2-11]|uniref:hypothetical protein n=1 Tax=Rhodanobacter sp. FW106-PBR-LB-2-11 TaxID=1524463 RepID=UPI0034E5F015